MLKNLPDQKIVSISEAAKYLDVSMDTVRRWDKAGVLHCSRPDGKTRYFSLSELERVKSSQPLTISQVAQKIGVSVSTLRRIEKKDLIVSSRDKNGERIYTNETIEKFLKSDYHLRQRSNEETVVEPAKEIETNPELVKLDKFGEFTVPTSFSLPGLFFPSVFVLLILLVIVSFQALPWVAQNLIPFGNAVIWDTWNYSSRSLLTFGGFGSTAKGPTFIYTIFIAGFVSLFLYMRVLDKKGQPIAIFRSWGNLGPLVILVLSISLGLVGGLRTLTLLH